MRFPHPSRWALLVALTACVPDFSPDPFDQPEGDASTSPRAVVRDASAAPSPSPSSREDASQPAPSAPPPAPELPLPSGEGCDLTGDWLMTERTMTSAVGAKQVGQAWYFVRIAQQGDAFDITRSLLCGTTVVGQPPVIITMDDSNAWSSYLLHPPYDGRRGQASANGEECEVRFDAMAVLRGASPEYVDLELPLPTLEQQAGPGQAGWEDWDGDGHPGVTLVISGTVSGSMYTATRTWTEASGRIAANASSFALPLTWGQGRATLGYEGSPLLTVEPGIDGDKAQHVVELARLRADQTAGDDAALCARLRDLAPTLTPNAMR